MVEDFSVDYKAYQQINKESFHPLTPAPPALEIPAGRQRGTSGIYLLTFHTYLLIKKFKIDYQ